EKSLARRTKSDKSTIDQRRASMATVTTVLQGFGFGTDQGTVGFCGVTLVQGGGKKILVDTAHIGRRQLLVQRLKEMGLSPRDIDVVVLTHAHWDHSLNMDLFP